LLAQFGPESGFIDLRFKNEAQMAFDASSATQALRTLVECTCFNPRSRANECIVVAHMLIQQACGLKYAHTLMRMEIAMPATQSAPRVRTSASGKRAINLSLSNDVLEAAKHLAINISQVCDNHLREVVRREQERKWREDHADFIAAYNATIEAEGLPLDEWRSF
jgi:antitoxin CcdA